MTTPGFTPSSPPPTAAGPTAVGPLGVPAGYKPPLGDPVPSFPTPSGLHENAGATNINDPGTIYGTVPNTQAYMPGDQYLLPFRDQQSIPQLQEELIQAGLLNPKTVRIGQWDSISASAYARVLDFANQYGLNAKQALDVFINNPKAGANAATQPIISFTNPADVATGYQNVSQNLTGMERPVGDFQQAFHAQEAASQHLRGQNYTQAPSITGAATQYVEKNDPSQVQAYGVASRMQDFFAMLPGVSG